jgi:hypothetical protein
VCSAHPIRFKPEAKITRICKRQLPSDNGKAGLIARLRRLSDPAASLIIREIVQLQYFHSSGSENLILTNKILNSFAR